MHFNLGLRVYWGRLLEQLILFYPFCYPYVPSSSSSTSLLSSLDSSFISLHNIKLIHINFVMRKHIYIGFSHISEWVIHEKKGRSSSKQVVDKYIHVFKQNLHKCWIDLLTHFHNILCSRDICLYILFYYVIYLHLETK